MSWQLAQHFQSRDSASAYHLPWVDSVYELQPVRGHSRRALVVHFRNAQRIPRLLQRLWRPYRTFHQNNKMLRRMVRKTFGLRRSLLTAFVADARWYGSKDQKICFAMAALQDAPKQIAHKQQNPQHSSAIASEIQEREMVMIRTRCFGQRSQRSLLLRC